MDPDAGFADDLAKRLRPYADVTTCTGFARARTQLRSIEPQFLITALALRVRDAAAADMLAQWTHAEPQHEMADRRRHHYQDRG